MKRKTAEQILKEVEEGKKTMSWGKKLQTNILLSLGFLLGLAITFLVVLGVIALLKLLITYIF